VQTRYDRRVVSSPDFLAASALEQARLVRTGELAAVELAAAYLERIGRLDGRLNAFVQVLAGRALRHARGKDGEAVRARRAARRSCCLRFTACRWASKI